MNDVIYGVGSRVIRRLLRAGSAADLITTFARIWLRHARVAAFLRTHQFDGVLDGGANIGEFADLVRDVLPDADLVAIEPHPPSAERLRRKGHRVVEAALWNEVRDLTLVQPTAASTSCSVVVEAGDRPSWVVPATRLDAIEIAGERVLVKLDLQGAELQALEGMGDLWSRTAGFLIEVAFGPHATYPAIARILHERGFEEYATLNEFELGGRVMEADKAWVTSRRGA